MQRSCNDHNFILGQLLVAANQPDNIETYTCNPNEVKLCTCINDLTTAEFLGIKEELAYIILMGNPEEPFFSYGFDSDKTAVLYSNSREKIPDEFISTYFKKHAEIMNENVKLKIF